MKRYIEIIGEILFKNYANGSWELIIEIKLEDITSFFMELQLLKFRFIDSITVRSLNSPYNINIKAIDNSNESSIKLSDKKYKIELSNNDIDAISAYLLQYYRDSYASVHHIHVDVAKDAILGSGGSLTVYCQ